MELIPQLCRARIPSGAQDRFAPTMVSSLLFLAVTNSHFEIPCHWHTLTICKRSSRR